MDADSLTSKDLFGRQVRYVIPTFQRPYIWKLEDPWEPFWEDVQFAAERRSEELDPDAPDDSRSRAEEQGGRHFLGAVVVKQERNTSAAIETREVIDGQQRLTTWQLLLDATSRVTRDLDHEDVFNDLQDLMRNKDRFAVLDRDRVVRARQSHLATTVIRAS